MKKKEYRSFLGFVNYHIFFTGFVITRYISYGKKRSRLRIRTVKSLFGHMKKNEIWKNI